MLGSVGLCRSVDPTDRVRPDKTVSGAIVKRLKIVGQTRTAHRSSVVSTGHAKKLGVVRARRIVHLDKFVMHSIECVLTM